MSEMLPQIDEYHNREIGGNWWTCQGCPSFRVHDFHYFYCRALGDQSKSDVPYSGGWKQIRTISFNREAGEAPPCERDAGRATLSKASAPEQGK